MAARGYAWPKLETIAGASQRWWIPTFTAVLLVMSSPALARDFPTLEGPLMGQAPPGLVAEPFAPGVISTDGWELQAVFAPGMDEFYFVTDHGYEVPTIVGFRFEDEVWTKFWEVRRTGVPTITADGQRMHLAKGYRERTADGWSDITRLGPMFDRKDWGIMRLTASSKGTYVFDDYKSGDLIRISEVVDDEREAPEPMGEDINSGEWTAHPFIAWDESYLIWDSEREGGYGESDLYIRFRLAGGSWGPATNMGPSVNSDRDDICGTVTPDGRFFMFDRAISGEGAELDMDIYWVDARVIDALAPDGAIR